MAQLGSNATAAGDASAISMQGVGGSNGLSQTMAICFISPHNSLEQHTAFVERVPGRRVRAVMTEGELSAYDVADPVVQIFALSRIAPSAFCSGSR
jgi:hypothetical protein